MNDWINKSFKWLDHNRYTAIGLGITVACGVYLAGCQSSTGSIEKPGTKVTRAELESEATRSEGAFSIRRAELEQKIKTLNMDIETYNAMLESAHADLDRQDAFRAQVFTAMSGAVKTALTGGGFDPVGMGLTGLGLLGTFVGGGALADNSRKNRKIEVQKAEITMLSEAVNTARTTTTT